nr:MAG TPA: hypothetical protein [Caudoviricetes sp.]DAO60590.1 MAG TPA: hypothetical protein [Caudoviricetes sp.]
MILKVTSVIKRKGRPTELALSVGSYSNLSQCKYTKINYEYLYI